MKTNKIIVVATSVLWIISLAIQSFWIYFFLGLGIGWTVGVVLGLDKDK